MDLDDLAAVTRLRDQREQLHVIGSDLLGSFELKIYGRDDFIIVSPYRRADVEMYVRLCGVIQEFYEARIADIEADLRAFGVTCKKLSWPRPPLGSGPAQAPTAPGASAAPAEGARGEAEEARP